MPGLLPILTASAMLLSVLVSVFILLQQNDYFPPESVWQKLRLLSADTAVSLTAALAGVGLTVRGMAQNAEPYLIYERMKVSESVLGLKPNRKGFQRIVLKNAGTGAAIFERVTYRFGSQTLSHAKLLEELNRQGMKFGTDYCLMNISKGYALKPEAEVILGEISLSKISLFNGTCIALHFRNRFSVCFEKEIFISG